MFSSHGVDGGSTCTSQQQSPHGVDGSTCTSQQQQEDPDPDVQHFMSIPWCAQRLQRLGDSKCLVLLAAEHRKAAAGSKKEKKRQQQQQQQQRVVNGKGNNSRAASTSYALGAISACLGFYRRPKPPCAKIDLFCSFVTFSDGLGEIPDTLHGGIVALVLDEVAGQHILAEMLLAAGEGAATPDRSFYNVSYLNTTFARPVPTSGTVLVQSKIIRVVGQKHFVLALIEDEHGEVLARAEALYITKATV